MIYCTATEANGRESIYEFMPLDGDPSKEEIKAAKKERYRKKVERQKLLIKDLVDKGVIKMPNKKLLANEKT